MSITLLSQEKSHFRLCTSTSSSGNHPLLQHYHTSAVCCPRAKPAAAHPRRRGQDFVSFPHLCLYILRRHLREDLLGAVGAIQTAARVFGALGAPRRSQRCPPFHPAILQTQLSGAEAARGCSCYAGSPSP